MAIIRSSTFFIPIDSWEDMKDLEEYFNESIDIADSIQPKPWTIRYVMPPMTDNISSDKCVKTTLKIYEKLPDKKIMIHPLSINSGSECVERVSEILSSTENLYVTIFLRNNEDIHRIVERIYLEDIDPFHYTRISITHYNMIQTPYFPSTSNIKNIYGFSFALRYLDLFTDFLNGREERIFDFLRKINGYTSSQYKKLFLGIDYSLSPWMDESVAELIEKTYDITLGEPGSYNAVYNMNKEIGNVIRKSPIKSLGFNEVMLPVGEDNLLKKRVRERTLRLGTLEGLSAMCVAGLDMVAVMKDKNILTKILSDMDKISQIKRRTVGTRFIPIPDGKTIKTNKFGEIPVISL